MIYEFGHYSLDIDRQELRLGSDPVAIEPQVFDLLQYLICNRERVVSKDDLIANVWHGRIVSESTLSSRITTARKVIGDSGEQQRSIRTIPRKGVRFVAEVRENRRAGALAAANPAEGQGSDAIPGSLLGVVPQEHSDRPSIAVLPFANMSGDPLQEYFSDGITENIITALSRLRWFFVIARNSTFAYKGRAYDVRDVGRDLGVRYLLEGSVQKSGQRIRITSQLIDAAMGSHMWAERYDRDLTDIFALQDEIATSVTAAIEPKLLAAEGVRAERRPSADLDAWDMVARAMTLFWKLTPDDNRAAIEILRQAVESHANDAPAHSLLAFALLVAAHMGWIPGGGDRASVERLARRAVELDENDPWAHMALGYLAFSARQTDEAAHHFRTAIDLNPNFTAAFGYLGWALSHDSRTDEAIANLEQAVRMSPRDPFNVFFLAGLAAAHYLAGRYGEAAEWARRALQIRPGHLGARRKYCASLAQAGRVEEAKLELSRLRQMQPDISIAWIKQAVPYTAQPMEHFLEGMRKAGLTE